MQRPAASGASGAEDVERQSAVGASSSAGAGPDEGRDGRFRGIVLVDGECVLCNGFVRFVAAHDVRGCFFFETQQSSNGTSLLRAHGLPLDLTTVVLIEQRPPPQPQQQSFTKSTAVLRVLSHLRFPINLLYAFIAVPRPVRDYVYNLVAGNRYRLFGRKDSCALPPAALRRQIGSRLLS